MEYSRNISDPLRGNTSNSFPLFLSFKLQRKKNEPRILSIPNQNFLLKTGKFYVKLFYLNGEILARQHSEQNLHKKFLKIYGHVTCFAVHPHGLRFAIGYEKGMIVLWNIPPYDITRRSKNFCLVGMNNCVSTQPILHLEFNENNELLAQSDETLLLNTVSWETEDCVLLNMGALVASTCNNYSDSILTMSHKEDTTIVTQWNLHSKKIELAYAQLTLPESLPYLFIKNNSVQ